MKFRRTHRRPTNYDGPYRISPTTGLRIALPSKIYRYSNE